MCSVKHHSDATQIHVPAVFATLQLDDDKASFSVETQQIDSALTRVSVEESPGNKKHVTADGLMLCRKSR